MPLYTFENTKTGKRDDFLYSMKDVPSIGAVITDENGETWKRIMPEEAPRAAIGANIDPFSKGEFLRSTENKKGTVGDMLDRSRELSEARAAKNGGVDPVREKFYKEYSKTRNGKKHPEQTKAEAKKKLKEKGIEIN